MNVDVAACGPAQREDYLRLLREAWGDAAIDRTEFDWWFDGNPAGSLMSVARTNGQVVGAGSHSLLRVALDGREELVAFSLHAVTSAAARGKGVFAAVETKNEDDARVRGAAAVISVPAESAGRVFLGKLGWTMIDELRLWARPLPRALRARTSVSHITQFEHSGDAASNWPNHVIRDAEYLNWRYLESPRGYVAVGDGAEYAVVGHKRFRGQPVAYVADLVARDPRVLLRASLAAVRRGTRAMLALPGQGEHGAYARHGFVPTPVTLHFMGKALAGGLNTDPAAWRLTLGDTDFF